MSTSSDVAGRACNKALIHESYLKEILGEGTRLQIIVIRLANPSQETHGSRPAQLKVKHTKHEPLGLKNFVDRVATVNHVYYLLNRGTIDLFVFSCNKDSGCADKLELPK